MTDNNKNYSELLSNPSFITIMKDYIEKKNKNKKEEISNVNPIIEITEEKNESNNLNENISKKKQKIKSIKTNKTEIIDDNILLNIKRTRDNNTNIITNYNTFKNINAAFYILVSIVQEYSYDEVINTLLKPVLRKNIKLDSLLQGIIDSEGINRVILMLLKLK